MATVCGERAATGNAARVDFNHTHNEAQSIFPHETVWSGRVDSPLTHTVKRTQTAATIRLSRTASGGVGCRVCVCMHRVVVWAVGDLFLSHPMQRDMRRRPLYHATAQTSSKGRTKNGTQWKRDSPTLAARAHTHTARERESTNHTQPTCRYRIEQTNSKRTPLCCASDSAVLSLVE